MPFKSRAQKEYLRINEPEIYERWMRDYDAESFTPPASAVSAAKKGLSQRKKWGRGGLSPADAKSQGIDSGVTRARKISSGKVSRHDVRRMSAFNRHRQNNNPSKKMPDGGPTAGTIAWNLWGGTSGVNWAKKKSAAMNAEDFEMMCRQCKIGNYESCLYGETVDTGGFWLSNCVPDPSMNAESFEAESAYPCETCRDSRILYTNLTQIRVDDGNGGMKLDICDSCLEKWESGVLFDAETFDAESWSPKKSMKQWMQHEEQTEEEVTWGYFHANLYPPNKLLTKIWTFEGKPNGSVEAWWNTITNQDDDEQSEQLEEVFERHYSIIRKSARKDVQQLIEEHNWYDMMSAETFESPVSCKICGKTFDSFRGLNGHMNAHLPSHRKRAEDEEEEELNKYMVSVPVLHHYTVGPVEAYDEEEAAEDVRENWSEWRRTIDNNGDWGGPMWRYLPWYDADPEAYEVFDSETFEAPLPPICRDCCLAEAGPHQLDPTGETRICIICTFHKKYKLGAENSDGQLAQALARARAKSQEPRRPLKITKLPHRDQTSLKDFEAESNTPLFTKESKVFAIGLASGIVATIFGNLLSEFVIDRYREDPELLDTEQNA